MSFTNFLESPLSDGAPFVLCSPGTALASGFRVTLGEGTPTGFWLSADGIGVHNGAHKTLFATNATATRTITFPDADLTFPAHGGSVPTDTVSVMSSDSTNSTTTGAGVGTLSCALLAGKTYEFEALLICRSASTGTGLQIAVAGPSGEVSTIVWDASYQDSTSIGNNRQEQYATAFGTYLSFTSAPAAGSDFMMRIRGVFTTTTTPSSALSLLFRSETGASTVTVKAGSFLRARALN